MAGAARVVGRSSLSLGDLLTASTLQGNAWGRTGRALAGPWCWPRHPDLVGHAARYGFVAPAGPVPGEVLLLSAPGSEGALWRLTRASRVTGASGPAAPCLGPIVKDAAESLALAWAVAARDLPLLVSLDAHLEPPSLVGELLATTGETDPVQLTGRSYGLSFALAAASLLLDTAVAARWSATAAIRSDGQLIDVDGLPQKIAALGAWGGGVEVLLVCGSQREEASKLADELAPGLEVVGVSSVVEAFERLFDFGRDGISTWGSAAARQRTLASLYRQAMGGGRMLLGWEAIARTAARIGEVATDHAERQRAELVKLIARRHEGRPARIPVPGDAELGLARRPERLELVAQVVQSWTDAACGAAELREISRWALDFVQAADLERHLEDYKVVGAVGRAQAAAQDFAVARDALRTAILGMIELRQAHQASHALCEYLRVTALACPSELEVSAAQALEAFATDERATDASRAFVALAQGRALVQAGRAVDGLEVLDRASVPWDSAPSHVLESRRRWQARACVALGEHQRCQVLRAELQRLPETSDYRLLAQIDAALEAGKDPSERVAELRRLEDYGYDVDRILAAVAPEDGPRQIAERWRY